MADTDLLIREYIKSFNERRLQDAADMFTHDAVIQHRPGSGPLKGPEGYLESARMAIGSFPNIRLQILHVEQRGDTVVEIDISATGTHLGDWTAGQLGTLKATGQPKTFRVREVLEIRGGKITFSGLTYDLQSLLGAARTARVMEDQPTRGVSNATGYELSRQVLLRSVAVVPQTPALYLLTTTAERYFPKFRFETIGRTDVATTVQTSLEFSSPCPSSATVMRKSL